jgi:hypothetical protein
MGRPGAQRRRPRPLARRADGSLHVEGDRDEAERVGSMCWSASDGMRREPRAVSYDISPDGIPVVHPERAWRPVLSPTSVVSHARRSRARAR